jgi:hypothetical protein
VVALREVGHVEKLEEIAVFLQKAENDCLRLPEFADIIAYCRACSMLVALQRANDAFSAAELSNTRPETFLYGSVGVEETVPCSSCHPHSGPGPDPVASLEGAYDLYVDILSYTSEERALVILHPVAKYMRWRLSRRDLSHVDELCGKMLITNRGQDLLGRYACLDIRLLASNLDKGEDDARHARQSLTRRYADFLLRVSGSNRMGMLGLVLLYHCHPFCKESEELREKCASHALECGEPLEKPGGDATNDPLASLRTLVQQSIPADGGGDGGFVDDAADAADAAHTGDPGDAATQDEGPPGDDRGIEVADGGVGGIAAMALAAMLGGS